MIFEVDFVKYDELVIGVEILDRSDNEAFCEISDGLFLELDDKIVDVLGLVDWSDVMIKVDFVELGIAKQKPIVKSCGKTSLI